MLPVLPKQTQSMQTRDGVRLDADIYRPDAAGPFPVLLMRQPYGRAIASTVVYAHPNWYAAHGYIVVIQDVRGRGSSEGEFRLFVHEVADGYDTVEWAAQLPGSDGQVGMYGFSYQGMTQLYAAQAQPPALKSLAPAMVGYDLYRDWAYENGALRLQAGLGWAIQLAAETARRKGSGEAFAALRAASRNLPLNGPVTADPDVLRRYAPDSFWHDWLAHPTNDAYWQSLKPDLSQVDLPMLHVGGWFDPYLTGDIRLYKEMMARGQSPQHLWVGPWGHIPWHRQVGAVDFGPAAMNPVDALQIRWFDQMLKHADTGMLAEDPVHLFEMGANQWRALKRWPTQGKTQPYWLKSTGLAAMREDDGHLVSTELAAAGPIDTLVHDPWRPVPAIGGHTSLPSGSFDRSGLDGRSDVLTYTSGPLETEIAIAGEVVVNLQIQSDAPSYDICAVLSVFDLNQTAFNLTQGYGRFRQAPSDREPAAIQLSLQPTCFCLQAGQALRLSLSAACFPAYTVNPGRSTPQPDRVPTLEQRIVTLTLTQGPLSFLSLPLAR
ncbi:MAG: CocE/NonD family hydrolase [Cyanobacteria bacterium J06629_9]